ncbi:hypothetical protein QFC19_007776 [Naganishia cerealis]|uniref:Uncharacterized protein n=1 Tax=Naganishia cerealis TaxID=610337 RepID=A0ACC2V8D9_9TREE|nr:hypothetical protein QFC19_007776 [Naganishia cerealis]
MGLNDKLYERRKAAALELEKVVSNSDNAKVTQIINQLCLMFTSPSSALHARNGGLIGLAATAIALGQEFAQWLSVVIPRVLGCFADPESRVRYYACESLYNIAKVCKGEILVHFNGIFDALSKVSIIEIDHAHSTHKLSADSEASVKNGAELLDRLLKDIVAETALNYVSKYPENIDVTYSNYGSEQWHNQDGNLTSEGKYPQSDHHYRQHALLHGAGNMAAKVIGVAVQEGNQVRRHPLEDSPVLASQELSLPPPASSVSGPSTASTAVPQPRSQGSISNGINSVPRPQTAGIIGMMGNMASLTDEPKTIGSNTPTATGSGDKIDGITVKRDTSPHGVPSTQLNNSKVGTSTPVPAISATSISSGHHRILSNQSAVPSTQVNHLSVVGNASSTSVYSTSPTPSHDPSSGLQSITVGSRRDSAVGVQGESSLEAVQHNQTQGIAPPAPRLAFSLAKFIPLLSERIYVISPFTRSHLVSWIMILDSVPDLELVSYLPEFLDGLLKYLSDPNPDVKIATETVLADFLREIKHIARVQQRISQDQLEDRGHSNSYVSIAGAQTTRRASDFHNSTVYPGLRRRASKNTINTEVSELDSVCTGTGTNPDAGDGLHTLKSMMSPDLGHLDELREEEGEFESGDGDTSAMTYQQGNDGEEEEQESDEHAAWIPGQGVYVDHACIIDTMIQHLSYPDEQIQLIALRWIASFLTFAEDVVVPFAPRLIPAILPNLAHHVPYLQNAAVETNQLLYRVIQNLPGPKIHHNENMPHPTAGSLPGPPPPTAHSSATTIPVNGSLGNAAANSASAPNSFSVSPGSRKDTLIDFNPDAMNARRKSSDQNGDGLKTSASTSTLPSMGSVIRPKSLAVSPGPSEPQTPVAFEYPNKSRPGSPSGIPIPVVSPAMTNLAQQQAMAVNAVKPHPTEEDPFDIRETVNVLTLQFVSEHEETRIAALEWLSMLHQKAPSELFAKDDGTFPALLKTLSDPSEEVIKHDLQLLAQISASSEDSWFASFLVKLLELFSTDRRLLETRGSLIIRQLCMNLNSERIFRTMAEVLEKDDDLEFASMMVVKLNMILITSPELSDFRKRLKSIESKAYEHASNLLQIFAELEMTVALLVQIDKLVMLIESPVFTSLRLQLLEPEKYPYLFKCLYGLLMLLPQSSAFVSLRNRLNAVSSMGYLHIVPKATYTSNVATTRSKIAARDEIKWEDMLRHFRVVQNRHEKARRLAQMGEGGQFQTVTGFNFASGSTSNSPLPGTGVGSNLTSTTKRKTLGGSVRKDIAHGTTNSGSKPQSSVLSPLNPRRVGGSMSTGTSGGNGSLSALSLGAPFSSSMQISAAAGATGPSVVNRPKSPPARSRVRGILPGLRKG